MSKTPAVSRREVTQHPRCYETHPPLQIGDYTVYGGSCSNPMVIDADVYIGLDHITAKSKYSPWNPGGHIHYPIVDMSVPQDPEDFKKLIDWLAVQLTALKKVHIGCIGGHGRTGLVLAALVTVMTGDKDSILYVRKNYCEKAVESASQVAFLAKYFDIKATVASKTRAMDFEDKYAMYARDSKASNRYRHPTPNSTPLDVSLVGTSVHPVKNSGSSIWGSSLVVSI